MKYRDPISSLCRDKVQGLPTSLEKGQDLGTAGQNPWGFTVVHAQGIHGRKGQDYIPQSPLMNDQERIWLIHQ